MTSHKLSIERVGRVPRSLPALIERSVAPETPETPDVDGVLLATLADAFRQLQAKHDALDTEVRRLRNRVAYLEGSQNV